LDFNEIWHTKLFDECGLGLYCPFMIFVILEGQ